MSRHRSISACAQLLVALVTLSACAEPLDAARPDTGARPDASAMSIDAGSATLDGGAPADAGVAQDSGPVDAALVGDAGADAGLVIGPDPGGATWRCANPLSSLRWTLDIDASTADANPSLSAPEMITLGGGAANDSTMTIAGFPRPAVEGFPGTELRLEWSGPAETTSGTYYVSRARYCEYRSSGGPSDCTEAIDGAGVWSGLFRVPPDPASDPSAPVIRIDVVGRELRFRFDRIPLATPEGAARGRITVSSSGSFECPG